MEGKQQQEEGFVSSKNFRLLQSNVPDLDRNNVPQSVTAAAASMALDKLSFAEVMEFADFSEKGREEGENSYLLRFPAAAVLADHDQVLQQEEDEGQMFERCFLRGESSLLMEKKQVSPLPDQKVNCCSETTRNRRKRPRSVKTSEEVESLRMTHIAVERNRRKQMNEHLRVLRSLMPGSYVQRGDQASIIGGAIEFVRELEQLLQCLESQKRRRLYGTDQPPQLNIISLSDDDGPAMLIDPNIGTIEDTAEIKSYLADVEVNVLGFDATIKILCRKRPGQLLKTIAALEDLQIDILHTNITTVEQTVLYSLNVKVKGGTRFSAEDIASSVQQIYAFINSSTV